MNDPRLDHPADLPTEFKEWLPKWLETTPPKLLASAILGLPAAINEQLPWHIDLSVFMTPISHTNWNNYNYGPIAGTELALNVCNLSSGAQNDAISWDVVLGAGTWTLELLHITSTDRGIYTVVLGGSSVGTIDGYSAAATYNVRSSVTGITVSSAVKQRLTLSMKTKNASSTNYYGVIQHVQLRRTA